MKPNKYNKWFKFSFALTFCISLFFVSCVNKLNTNKPNVIIFFTDDQGYGDLGCYGAEGFQTPHIDQLAANGIRFTDFYVAASVCTPSRAALLTGKYPKQVGLQKGVLFPFSDNGLSPDETTLPELLKPLGYNTACIGKWHLGHLEQFMPNNQGFDFYYGVPYSNDMDKHYYKRKNFQSPPLPVFKNEELVEEGPNQDSLTIMWTNSAVDYIHKNREQPFFLYLAHNMPHRPWHVSGNFKGSSSHGLYGDAIQELDWSMGEIINALKKDGILKNTIVIFTSDNGPAPRKNGGSAGPLRGRKGTTWEGGFRVPGIISWPATIPKGIVCDQPISTLDLLPTLIALAGGEVPKNLKTYGRDIRQILLHPKKDNGLNFELLYYGTDGNLEAIRQDNWKLHIAKTRGWLKQDGEFPISLYNLTEDIGENTNVAKKHPDIVKKLLKQMQYLDDEIF